jgi:hypothetical protein
MLQGAALGIDRMYFHNGLGYFYVPFEPAGDVNDGLNYTRPHIGPLYYAYLVVGEAIGTSRNAWVSELGTTNTSISAYGIWEDTKLVRAVVVNHNAYVNATAPRNSYNVNFVNYNVNVATVKTLTAPLTSSQRNM